MSAQLATLQQQVESLFSDVSSMRSQIWPPEQANGNTDASAHTPFPEQPRRTPSLDATPGRLRRFHGPTSAVFNLGVAKSSLRSMGITGNEERFEEGYLTSDATPAASPPPTLWSARGKRTPVAEQNDPLCFITKEEATRLVQVWQDEMGCMYPVINADGITKHANELYTFVEAAKRSALMGPEESGTAHFLDQNTVMLKLVLAAAATLEGSGKSELGRIMYNSIAGVVESLLVKRADMAGLQILILAVGALAGCNFPQRGSPI